MNTWYTLIPILILFCFVDSSYSSMSYLLFLGDDISTAICDTVVMIPYIRHLLTKYVSLNSLH